MTSIPILDKKQKKVYIEGGISEIKKVYKKWVEVKDENPEEEAKLKRKRGYKLETIIYSILCNEGLNPSSAFKKIGEQIDGAFTYNNLPFLLEAKWHIKPIEASKLYDFKGKVDGKFHLTSGVFISMSGYAKDTELALITGKIINIILFTGKELELIINSDNEKNTFKALLEYKISTASKTGVSQSKSISETEII